MSTPRPRVARKQVWFVSGAMMSLAGCGAILGIDDVEYVSGVSVEAGAVEAASIQDAGHADGANATDAADAADAAHPCSLDAASFVSDPSNCGQCGHDCLGGMCEAGVCQSVTIGTCNGAVTDIAVDSTRLYWTSRSPNGFTVCADKNNCDGGVFNPLSQNANSVVLAGRTAYVTTDNQVVTFDTLSSNSTALFTASAGIVDQASLRDGGIVFTIRGGVQEGFWQVDVDSGAVTELVSFDGSVFPAGQLHVAVLGNNAYVDGPNALLWCDLTSCSALVPIEAGAASPSRIACDGTHVYFAPDQALGSAIQSCTSPGCGTGPTTLIHSDGYPIAIHYDSGNLYWLTDAALMTCAVNDCTRTVHSLAVAPHQGVLAVDTASIIWVSNPSALDAAAPSCVLMRVAR